MRKALLFISILLTYSMAQSELFGLFGTTIDTSDRGITISNTDFEPVDFMIFPEDEEETRYFSGKLLNRYTSKTITQVTVQITVKGCDGISCTTYDIKEVDLFDFKDNNLPPNQARYFSKKFEHNIPAETNSYSFKVIKVKGY
jgi:hypothetical protein